MENRRDARRAGVIAGAITTAAVQTSANNQAEARYQDCQMATNYDPVCERARYEDERRARQNSRQAGALMGAAAYSAVRD